MMTYDQDFFQWTQETARAIEEGRFDEIDRAALADEVESLGKRDRRELGSRMAVIVLHMLKLKYQPEREARSWHDSIGEQREQIAILLVESPSLLPQLPKLLGDYYPLARRQAANQTGIKLAVFPPTCEWTVEQVLGGDCAPQT